MGMAHVVQLCPSLLFLIYLSFELALPINLNVFYLLKCMFCLIVPVTLLTTKPNHQQIVCADKFLYQLKLLLIVKSRYKKLNVVEPNNVCFNVLDGRI